VAGIGVRRSGFLAASMLALASSALALDVKPVAKDVFAIVGPKEQRSAENLGNNATFGVIVTPEGVVLVDPGGSWKGAEAIDKAIAGVTDKPVKVVINSGGQDHRWLGNGYWNSKGAKIIASEAAIADHKARGAMQMEGLKQFLGDKLAGTEPVYADTAFKDEMKLSLAGVNLLIRHAGQAHTTGDSFIWLADRKVMFTGDIVYVERILGVGPQSNSGSWIKAFEAMANLGPSQVVPGHGGPTDLATAKRDTLDYLANLRNGMKALIDKGGSLADAPKVDQSAFRHLEQFDSLAGRNAAQVFTEMELE
jgi:glyoxylase-like metal-dependent hydrolase (beta-lactamase superfamily II)